MAESGSFYSELPDSDSENMRDSLWAKQLLLQKVCSELDEEREASSTAANEAMSMILRLQGEKAQLKMEASQYKREAEEKMCLAEESLAIFEDLLYQKEMEIANLEYQVQAYRDKLSDMGCSDLDIPEYKFPDSLQQQRNDSFLSELDAIRSNVRRHDSLPSLAKDLFPKKAGIERERSVALMPEDQEMSFLFDLEKRTGSSAGGDVNSYWERIRKLDEQMKEISDGKIHRRHNCTSSRNRLRSCSVPPPDPEDSSLSSSPTMAARWDQNNNSKNSGFESKSRGVKETESHVKSKMPPFPKTKDKSCSKQREKASELSLPFEYQAEIERLSQRIWRLENKETSAGQEISVEGGAGMMMVKEIMGQLDRFKSEFRKYTTTKSDHLDEQGLIFLREAMVYFWL